MFQILEEEKYIKISDFRSQIVIKKYEIYDLIEELNEIINLDQLTRILKICKEW